MTLMDLLSLLSYIVIVGVAIIVISVVMAVCGAYYFLRIWLNDTRGYKLPPRFKDHE